MTLFALAVLTGLAGLWMATGVWDNWRFPEVNRRLVGEVMRLERLETAYPEVFAPVAHRRASARSIRLCFRAVVLWETSAALLLCAGAAMLFGAALAGSEGAVARPVALLGALAFTATWAGFLAGGNYFLYYYCHFEGQMSHFMLLIWGTTTTLALLLA